MQTRQKTTSNQMTDAAPNTPVDPFAVDTAQTAQMPPDGQAAQSGEQTYPVPVDGEMRELTLDEQQEGSLVSAYRKWEILTLKDELAALEMNQKNRRAAVGAAQSDGEPAGVDPVTLALLGK